MLFTGESTIALLPQTAVNFTANSAARGGAVAVEDITPFTYCILQDISADQVTKCFLQFPVSGLYGGSVDNCYLESTSASAGIDSVINSDSCLNVSSDPIRVCLCEDSISNCGILEHYKSVFPGGTMQLLAVALGQRNGTVPATVLVFRLVITHACLVQIPTWLC